MPNCTGYAWGRALELLNSRDCNLSVNNADLWFNNQDGYKRGQIPKLGAIICYSGGSLSGHVAVVEKINNDGSILVSESSYGGNYFETETIPNDYSYYNYTFQGFIYLPIKHKKRFNWLMFDRRKSKIDKKQKILYNKGGMI